MSRHKEKKSEDSNIKEEPVPGEGGAEAGKPQASKETEGEAIARLQNELVTAKDERLRMLAELENTKKRLQRDCETFRQFASESLVRKLLAIVDSLDSALSAAKKHTDAKAIIEGVRLIHRQLLEILGKEGVRRIEAIGAQFDPNLHEAIGHLWANEDQPEDTIVEELRVGYVMNGKVIRPAMVRVAKREADGRQETPPKADAPLGRSHVAEADREEHTKEEKDE